MLQMAHFYFIRHGETESNAKSRLCGRSDVPLSETGREQARKLAERLGRLSIQALYTSPLGRARETAEIIAQVTMREPIVVESLAELDYGAWEGKTFAEIMEKDPETLRAWERNPADVAPPEGETGLQALNRVVPFLHHLASHHDRGNVVVVCHKTICRLVVCHVLGLPISEYRRRLTMDNAAINIIQPWEDGWRLVLFNDTSHLPGGHRERGSKNEDF